MPGARASVMLVRRRDDNSKEGKIGLAYQAEPDVVASAAYYAVSLLVLWHQARSGLPEAGHVLIVDEAHSHKTSGTTISEYCCRAVRGRYQSLAFPHQGRDGPPLIARRGEAPVRDRMTTQLLRGGGMVPVRRCGRAR